MHLASVVVKLSVGSTRETRNLEAFGIAMFGRLTVTSINGHDTLSAIGKNCFKSHYRPITNAKTFLIGVRYIYLMPKHP